jgi:hypothetical protein
MILTNVQQGQLLAKWDTVRTFVTDHKKWFIGAALLLAVWLPIAACSHKPAPKAEPVKIERKVEAPYTVTKTDTKIVPHKAKHRHRVVVKAPAPAPKCYFFLAEYNC